MSYATAEYIRSLADFGAPRTLARSGGFVLERTIPQRTRRRDACGPYPLFACRDWDGLPDDLEDLRREGLVSLVVVVDPLARAPEDRLHEWFDGVCRPWKTHHLVDLAGDAPLGSPHHRRNARRSGRHAAVEIAAEPPRWLDTWCDLYAQLVRRHGITGPATFSREAFAHQLALPGALVLRAVTDAGQTAGMQIWLTEGGRAWHHLSAYGPEGYRWGGASYALVAAALDELRRRGLRVADLGAGAGLDDDPADGLARFKRGWATRTAPAWLCGAVLDPVRYAELSDDHATAYFPAYRDPARIPAPEVSGARGA